MSRVIIAGGRDFDDWGLLHRTVKKLLSKGDTIISGGAKGADALGEQFAKRNSKYLELEIFPADWDKYGKGAGYVRNHQMALTADTLIAFWDGRSKGTKNMIEEAHKARLNTHVFYYGEAEDGA